MVCGLRSAVCSLQSANVIHREQINLLDYQITEQEIYKAVEKLKNKKSPFVDKIRNEMIKLSLELLMPIYINFLMQFYNLGKCQIPDAKAL